MTASPTVRALKLGVTWCYLIRCPDGYLLIDTSYPNRFSQFLRSIAALGIDIQKIRYLLLTHHHDDHAGFAAELVEKTGCRVIAHRNAVEALTIGESEDTMRPVNRRVQFLFALFTLFHRRFRFPPLVLGENDIVLPGDDFDLLRGIGINGRIAYTPGHTRDSISVILSDGSAFVGDVAMNFLRQTGIGHRPIFVEDIQAVYTSWQRLIEFGAKVIYPSHGKPFSARELAR
ncbi:MAG TPA: MBL fold metallo-hydrolase [Syntrophales bacterium]|nr:MBL fold metallo-hydrolase [Syntrophales bacterium]HPQ45250.1 MBL fold metallo-hydrolase [Syntrophales bacterium]